MTTGLRFADRLVPWQAHEASLTARLCQGDDAVLKMVTREFKGLPNDRATFLCCRRHGSVSWEYTVRAKVTHKLHKRQLAAFEAEFRLGGFQDGYEIDMFRYRAHLAVQATVNEGAPELLCGREYRYGYGGWNGVRPRQTRWQSFCPNCAWDALRRDSLDSAL